CRPVSSSSSSSCGGSSVPRSSSANSSKKFRAAVSPAVAAFTSYTPARSRTRARVVARSATSHSAFGAFLACVLRPRQRQSIPVPPGHHVNVKVKHGLGGLASHGGDHVAGADPGGVLGGGFHRHRRHFRVLAHVPDVSGGDDQRVAL